MDLYSLKASELDSLINKAQEVKGHLEQAEGLRTYLASLPEAVKALVGLPQPVEAVKDLPLFIPATQEVIQPVEENPETIKVISRNGTTLRIYVLKPKEGKIEMLRGLMTCGDFGASGWDYEYSADRVKIAKAMRVCAAEGWHLNEMQAACYCKRFGVVKNDTSNSNLCTNFDPFRFSFEFVKSAFVALAQREKNTIVQKLNEI